MSPNLYLQRYICINIPTSTALRKKATPNILIVFLFPQISTDCNSLFDAMEATVILHDYLPAYRYGVTAHRGGWSPDFFSICCAMQWIVCLSMCSGVRVLLSVLSPQHFLLLMFVVPFSTTFNLSVFRSLLSAWRM